LRDKCAPFVSNIGRLYGILILIWLVGWLVWLVFCLDVGSVRDVTMMLIMVGSKLSFEGDFHVPGQADAGQRLDIQVRAVGSGKVHGGSSPPLAVLLALYLVGVDGDSLVLSISAPGTKENTFRGVAKVYDGCASLTVSCAQGNHGHEVSTNR
jgi:hypothetical protein